MCRLIIITHVGVENPKLVLIMGGIGLAMNLMSGWLLGHHGWSDDGYGDGYIHVLDDASEEETCKVSSLPWTSHLPGHLLISVALLDYQHKHPVHEQFQTHHSHRDLGALSVLIHVAADAANNVGVMASALVIWLANFEGRFYADPAASMAIAVMIMLSSIPICMSSFFPSFILLFC